MPLNDQIQVRLSKGLLQQYQRLAKHRKKTVAYLIRQAIHEHYEITDERGGTNRTRRRAKGADSSNL